MPDILILTRVCIDDFDIFKIWHEYYSRRFKNIACCLFKRPYENVDDVKTFLKENNIFFIEYENGIFDNETTLNILKEISAIKQPEIIIHLDSDEFVDDLFCLEEISLEILKTKSAGLLEMQDRINQPKELYDISDCKNYEDLCSIAPNCVDITGEIQGWETKKCCINVYPYVGLIHFPDVGIQPKTFYTTKIQHFKWRKNWAMKAKRRYMETIILGYFWADGIKKALQHFNYA